MESNQLKLYSLSEAATALCIGRDTLRSLINEGRIGYILVGRSKRISHQELIRFQSENTLRRIEPVKSKLVPDSDMQKMFKSKNQKLKSNYCSEDLLKNIIRDDKNGNDKKKRKDVTYSMVRSV